MQTLSRPVLVSIATIVLNIVVVVLSVGYVLYMLHETLAYYGLGVDEWRWAVGRRLGLLVAVVGVVLGVLIAALVGQALGRRWASWLAVVLHVGMAALCVIAFVVGGFEITSAVLAVVVAVSNLAAVVFLVMSGRGEMAGGATIQEPPPPPLGFD